MSLFGTIETISSFVAQYLSHILTTKASFFDRRGRGEGPHMAADYLSLKVCEFISAKYLCVFKSKTGMAVTVESVGSVFFMPVIIEKVMENGSSCCGNIVPTHFLQIR